MNNTLNFETIQD